MLLSSISDEDCKDGVCAMPFSTTSTSGGSAIPVDNNSLSDNEAQIKDLVLMGFDENDAKKALEDNNNDLEAAASALENQMEIEEKNLSILLDFGWNEDACKTALQECNGNSTLAHELLEQEETSIQEQFGTAVDEMVSQGWDELVARQALLAQWTIDQRRASGMNTTVEASTLEKIKPTLKQEKKQQPNTNTNTKTKTKSKASNKTSKKEPTKPKPAKKEDCVFDVTIANFQQVVLESPVPVLLDVYADWCGPCKQLGPVLEKAAMDSGGMFRLAKVNSDTQSAISSSLGVQGLPTVFAVNNGKMSDRFVGMLPQEQLQQFLVRTITGYGDRVQGDQISDTQLKELTSKVGAMAGLAGLTGPKKARIRGLVDEALAEEGSIVKSEGGGVFISEEIKTALTYISNAESDVRNPKFRYINGTAKAFISKIVGHAGAEKILKTAGFRKVEENKADSSLELVHNNIAVLQMVRTRVGDRFKEIKFQGDTGSDSSIDSFSPLGTSTSLRRPKAKTTESISSSNKKNKVASSKSKSSKKTITTTTPITSTKSTKTVLKSKTSTTSTSSTTITVAVRTSSGAVLRNQFSQKQSSKLSLREALEQVIEGDINVRDLILQSPVRRELTEDSEELEMSLKEFGNKGQIVLAFKGSTSTSKKKSKKLNIFSRKKKTQNTLFSTGIMKSKQKKNNELFGGDSTVVQAGEEEEEEEE